MRDSVFEFQRIFDLAEDAVIGNATWYKIQQIYNGVKRLNELNSEGLTLSDISSQYPEELYEGLTGNYVRVVQYYLAVIGENIDTVPEIAVDGIYGPQTAEAVRAFQREYGLPGYRRGRRSDVEYRV